MQKFFKSFRYAWRGIVYVFRSERNFQIEAAAAVLVMGAIIWFPLSATERSILLLSIAIVLSLELANTALERVIDMLKPRVHPYAKVVKDIMAGVVLLATLFVIAVGVVILLPYVAGK